MLTRSIWFFLMLFFLSTPLAYSKGKKSWSEDMQGLATELLTMLPDLNDDKKFEEKLKNKSFLKRLDKIITHSKGVEEKAKELKYSPDSDPTLQLIAETFSDDLARAKTSLHSKNYAFARTQLLKVSRYCIACHSRSSEDGWKMIFPVEKNLEKISKIDQAGVYVATRNYGKAMDVLFTLLPDRDLFKSDPITWERALKLGLVISVRVQENSQLALDMINKGFEATKEGEIARNNLELWRKSILAWRSEKKEMFNTQASLIKENRRVFKRAQSLQTYQMGEEGVIDFLRSTALAHRYLRNYGTGEYSAESLYMAGVGYEVLRDMEIWPLHELFYELCIKKKPHSKIAESCFKRFETSVTFGFTGSMGEIIPESVKRQIKELKNLSSKK